MNIEGFDSNKILEIVRIAKIRKNINHSLGFHFLMLSPSRIPKGSILKRPKEKLKFEEININQFHGY